MPDETVKYISQKPDLNQVLIEWTSPSHPYKKRSRLFYQTVATFTFLLVVIVFFLREFLLIGVILSVAFVIYAIYSVPPITVEHKITPLGFNNAGRLFRWNELAAFWFEEKWGIKMLVIQTHLSFLSQIRAVLNDVSDEKVKKILDKYLLYVDKAPKSIIDRLSDWVSQNIPLETKAESR
ncbi:hypothetical protein A3D05_03585 [Candidatus Gottesmanbacteria bacterium RIFCSPHIGHO2_02_FULL_40_24]|uniref:DUF5673 domain-containing protein n=1 Tax=Candidatus Gottesmanbacteria bacterium RIFCSPHIGHO2_01_FULL_40_15 TaxID=1798376 RepID=A0A1F5Z401_9BACT|nr:MAG: hypothetical protein A2777_03375 [Candidatus Gottesmanbacteria bacterium RIFCSPHIGHO2_01_FULL_40_15]OGG17907.1 MAG: hypothetical protein A3D05_03585 [Candidatus Gottesmanbacteria bacterium RIFCSPHIGHO2_02_FULL_40_24]OGG20894.1 MAG: hypothetical protein A3B48_05805 [Candidatus Gottesmanbacteria bacterium RIFCSPLOWO2_01_FULL_40_10]OGG24746.1 MAG: hypothetical protein A3E42_01750 [Candidatus Gottesmanbacteria bacterium RIFCSPHIGHO2_12_FULL_40_13]OGG33903.1 MAG: hypothetical protein A3I80_0